MIVFLLISTSIHVAICSESSKLVFGQVGDTVTLPCKYDINASGLLNICWGRHQSWFHCENTVISSDGLQVNYRESQRFSLVSGLDRGDVSLTIRVARNTDAGLYVCRIEIPGPFNDISHNVYLFISNGLDPKRVISETQLVLTTAKQEQQDPTTLITEFYITPEKITADITGIYIAEPVAVARTEEAMDAFVINTVKGGAIVFIPGLIIAFLFNSFILMNEFEQESHERASQNRARTAALQKAHQQQGKLADLPSPTITTHGYDSHV